MEVEVNKLRSEPVKAPSVARHLRLVDQGDGVALVEWNVQGQRVNILSSKVLLDFKRIYEELLAGEYKAAVFVSRKPRIFIAGADIGEIQSLSTAEEFAEMIRPAHGILNAFEDMPLVSIAAINGACLGGGCEWALACNYRIASTDPSTQIGLPETRLGLIPGFGGCWRLPRTVGLAKSLEVILAGRALRAKQALRCGLVDEVVALDILEQHALKRAREWAGRPGAAKRVKRHKPRGMMGVFLESALGRKMVFKKARQGLMRQAGDFYPAPWKALKLIEQIYTIESRDEALERELEAFCHVAPGQVSRHLINLFYMMEGVKKRTGVVGEVARPAKVKRLGLMGAGVMGGGIAFAAANVGIDTRMRDIGAEPIRAGLAHAHNLWLKKLKRRHIDKYEMQQKESLLSATKGLEGFANCDVVVEAVVEDLGIKKNLFKELSGVLSPDCVVATNTSSLSVEEMSKAYARPDKFVGMHFFNPVDRMPLVEVVRASGSSDESVARVFALAKQMGKTPVVVKDAPGFLVNRILLPYLSESLFLLEEGWSVEQIDQHYTKNFGFPMGPLRLFDEIGHDTGVKVLGVFEEALGQRVGVSPVVERIKSWSRLGKKNKKGFYVYTGARGKDLRVDTSVYAELGVSLRKGTSLGAKECVQRGVFRMVNEAAQALLAERVAQSAGDVDLAMILGTGFPPFRGGLLRYADTVGVGVVVDGLRSLADKHASPRFEPLPALKDLAQSHKNFYVN